MKTEERCSPCPLRIAVLGSGQVGKSALTVRYLTKRFIGEYRSDSDMLYRCVLTVDGSAVPVEIMDTCGGCDASTATLAWAEAFVVVYAVTDKHSYTWAAETVQELLERRPSSCVLVLGNKSDLQHLREVEEVEAQSLPLPRTGRFSEVSTAEGCAPLTLLLDNFVKEVRTQRACGNTSGNTSPKQRKLSVTKMLGSLIGRHSPPPQPITELIILDKEERSKLVRCSRQI